ncbi:interactor protein for cytohesin exchange factors 1 isoform X2 [Bombina bombina]|uniref:interactor protein for cytohesin exchange factors 1 isoform X2 n=1 Tax=Bombina bombina TaxID=8345 RepID=UPI00235AA487|nr:interactor protein for cytohesin exchange factors 1 isoform X2 [Bombina bombina]
MASDGNEGVSLRPKLKKPRGSIFSMSRRRISCKDLGNADCQGWMYKKKEKAFLGNKWKKIWAVLKGSCLYWYTNQLAEKAEGFVNLPDFIVNPAVECKKKNAIKISNPKVKTFYFAAENREEMNKWLNKLGLAVIIHPEDEKKEEECWSESEQDDQDATEIPPSSCTAQQKCDDSSLTSELTTSLRDFAGTPNSGSSESILDNQSASEIDEISLSQDSCQTEIQIVKSDFSIVNTLPNEEIIAIKSNLLTTRAVMLTTEGKEQRRNTDDDEMERLYKSLEQASLSPIGDRRPSTKRELRKSFIKRCKNPSINDKLHKIRTLNSTLKCKEHDLAMINQLLQDNELTSTKYRTWKDTNVMLFQDLYTPPCFTDSTEITIDASSVENATCTKNDS